MISNPTARERADEYFDTVIIQSIGRRISTREHFVEPFERAITAAEQAAYKRKSEDFQLPTGGLAEQLRQTIYNWYCSECGYTDENTNDATQDIAAAVVMLLPVVTAAIEAAREDERRKVFAGFELVAPEDARCEAEMRESENQAAFLRGAEAMRAVAAEEAAKVSHEEAVDSVAGPHVRWYLQQAGDRIRALDPPAAPHADAPEPGGAG